MMQPAVKNSQVFIRNEVVIPIGPEAHANFISFHGFPPADEHFALQFGEIKEGERPVVRLHSECITGDVFGSLRCDCGNQLREAIEMLSREGGVLLYLRQEGRGIGLYAKLDAYRLQDQGLDTFEANRHLALPDDGREYGCAAMMLQAMGLRSIRLLSNNPNKAQQLRQHGIEVTEMIPTGVFLNRHNVRYLHAKAQKGRHSLRFPLERVAEESGRTDRGQTEGVR